MRLIKSVSSGEWFVYATDGKGKESIEFQVRQIPALKAKEIEINRLGHKRQRRFKGGEMVAEHDVERNELVIIDKALYALVDSRNAELPAADVPALTNGTPRDGFVTLDGHWTEEVKAQAFASFPELALWVVGKASTLRLQAQEEEEGKGRS